MVRTTLIVIAAIFALSPPAVAQLPLPLPLPQFEGTPEDRAACEADVRRYCQNAIPDNMRVLACLQQNRQRIAPACRGVLEKYGQ
jgi:Cysteine rich repeat